ncbi:ThiF family adenylyltransferase [Euryarchaeota archaeon]|nr:ThiF family adenylyltransferase [Euryarchaeota archaeon]
MKDEISIAIVGVGGIGSNLTSLIVPSLSQGNLSQRFTKININLYDSDKVEEANIFHQRFNHSNISETKVMATKKNLASFEHDKLEIIAHEKDVRVRKDIEDNNLIVVCVDSSDARIVVHSTDCIWLDLRCRGDNFMAIDHTVTKSDINKVTDQNQQPGSCQYEGAVDSGNIQFGFINAASFGCQWIIQNLRTINMEKNVIIPFPRSESITFGTLGKFEKKTGE